MVARQASVVVSRGQLSLVVALGYSSRRRRSRRELLVASARSDAWLPIERSKELLVVVSGGQPARSSLCRRSLVDVSGGHLSRQEAARHRVFSSGGYTSSCRRAFSARRDIFGSS